MNANLGGVLRPESERPTKVKNCCFKTAVAFTPCEDGTHCCYLPPGHEGQCRCDDCAALFDPQTPGEVRFVDTAEGEHSLVSVKMAGETRNQNHRSGTDAMNSETKAALGEIAKSLRAAEDFMPPDDAMKVFLKGNRATHPCAAAMQILQSHEDHPATLPKWATPFVTARPGQPGLFYMGFNDRVRVGDWLVVYHCGAPFGFLVSEDAFPNLYTEWDSTIVYRSEEGPKP